MAKPGDSIDIGAKINARPISCLIAELIIWAFFHAQICEILSKESRDFRAGDYAHGSFCRNIAIEGCIDGAVGAVRVVIALGNAHSCDVICETDVCGVQNTGGLALACYVLAVVKIRIDRTVERYYATHRENVSKGGDPHRIIAHASIEAEI